LVGWRESTGPDVSPFRAGRCDARCGVGEHAARAGAGPVSAPRPDIDRWVSP